MNLKEQLYVCTLAECQTISKAAEQLYISQPSLSVYISNLEKKLGAPLFTRRNKKFELTPIGEEYVKRAREMLALKEDFDQLLKTYHGNEANSIRIGMQQRRAVLTATGIMTKIMECLPSVQVEILDRNHDELIRMVIDDELDLVIANDSGKMPNLHYQKIVEEPLVLVVREDHSINRHAIQVDRNCFPYIDIKHLENEIIILPFKGQSIRTSITHLLNQRKVKPKKIIEIGNLELSTEMVVNGAGISFNRLGYLKTIKDYPNIRYYYLDENHYSDLLVAGYKDDIKINRTQLNQILNIISNEIENSINL